MQHALTTIQKTDPQRFARAAAGLADGTLTVEVIAQDHHEIRALVTNGYGKDYTAVITTHDALCGCKDWLYRGRKVGPCKHLTALAVYAIQHPHEGAVPGMALAA